MKRDLQSRGSAVGSVLATIAIMFCAVWLVVWAIKNNVKIVEQHNANGGGVKIQTPVGSMQVREARRLDPQSVGIPVYPGATAAEKNAKGATIDFQGESSEKRFTVATAYYETHDAANRVIDFYKSKMPHGIISSQHGEFKIDFSEEGYKRFIVIHQENPGDLTSISIVSTGDPGVI